MKPSVNDYTREEECIYKDERYSVRDNDFEGHSMVSTYFGKS